MSARPTRSSSRPAAAPRGFSPVRALSPRRRPVSPGKMVTRPTVLIPSNVVPATPRTLLREVANTAPQEDEKQIARWKSWRIRTISTLVMIGSFLFIVWSGHTTMMLLTAVILFAVFKEIMDIGYNAREKKPPAWWLQWYFFAAAVIFIYGRALSTQFINTFGVWFMDYHVLTGFSLLVAGLIMVVTLLQRQYYKPQIRHFARILVTLVLTVLQCGTMMYNLFQGMLWFLLPVSLVICNDIFAYIFGFFFGRTQLVSVSPKKTWEGFIGALFSTIVWGVFFVWVFSTSEWMLCPKADLTFSLPTCEIASLHASLFVAKSWSVPVVFRALGLPVAVTFAPVYLHAVAMAIFTSLVAPFGGFLASGVKRAFRIKDFGDYIPGHGGATDRMDCQFLAGTFVFVWNLTFVWRRKTPVAAALEKILALDQASLLTVLDHLMSMRNNTVATVIQNTMCS